jgi:hypothetical protein
MRGQFQADRLPAQRPAFLPQPHQATLQVQVLLGSDRQPPPIMLIDVSGGPATG